MNLLLTSKSLWWVTIVDNKFNFQNCGCWRLELTESPLPFLDSESLSDGNVCQEHKGDQYNDTGLGCTYVFETDLFENLGHTCSFCKPLCHEQSFGVLWKKLGPLGFPIRPPCNIFQVTVDQTVWKRDLAETMEQLNMTVLEAARYESNNFLSVNNWKKQLKPQ